MEWYDEAMHSDLSVQERERMRQWVETWQRAGLELDEIRRREIQSTDTQTAIRQIFGSAMVTGLPPRTTSGLVEQQAWFMKLAAKTR
jgi:hypothetical protein